MKNLVLSLIVVGMSAGALAYQVPDVIQDARDRKEQREQETNIRALVKLQRADLEQFVNANSNILNGSRKAATDECQSFYDRDLELLCKVAILKNRELSKDQINKIANISHADFYKAGNILIRLVNK